MSYDFNAFNNRVSATIVQAGRLEELLATLDCNIKKVRGNRHHGSCPVHGSRKVRFEVITGGDTLPVRWFCYSRGCHETYKPSLLGLVRGVQTFRAGKPVSPFRAVEILKTFIGSTPSVEYQPVPQQDSSEFVPLNLTPEQVRSRLQIPSPFFVDRGFSRDVLLAMDVGHSIKRGTSIVPLYDATGEVCVSFADRTELPLCEHCEKHHRPGPCGKGYPKWNFQAAFPKTEYLYNNAAAFKSHSPFVLLVEGPADVWRAMEAGVPAVASLGSSLSRSQAEMLASLHKHVVVAYDADDAGRAGAVRAVAQLQALHLTAKILQLPVSVHDVGEMPAEQVRELVVAA